jgi:hypothetical protein
MSVTSSTSASASPPRARMALAASSISRPVRRRERYLRAGLSQRRGRCKPDAAPAAGDERAPPVKAEGGSFRKID